MVNQTFTFYNFNLLVENEDKAVVHFDLQCHLKLSRVANEHYERLLREHENVRRFSSKDSFRFRKILMIVAIAILTDKFNRNVGHLLQNDTLDLKIFNDMYWTACKTMNVSNVEQTVDRQRTIGTETTTLTDRLVEPQYHSTLNSCKQLHT